MCLLLLSLKISIARSDILSFLSRSTALGSALLAGAAIKLFGWNIADPETLREVNTKGTTEFRPHIEDKIRRRKWEGWQRAVERSKGWEEGVDE